MPRVVTKQGANNISDEAVGSGFVEYEDVFEAAFEPGQAAVLRAHAMLVLGLRRMLIEWKGSTASKAAKLNISPARLNIILNSGGVTKVSIAELIKIAGRAGLSPSIQLRNLK